MQEEKKIFHFSKPISFRVQKEKEFQDTSFMSIEFGDIDVGTVRTYVRKVVQYIKKSQSKLQQNHIETMARALGKNFVEVQQSYKNSVKTEEVKKIETTPADLIDILYDAELFEEFENEVDKILVKTSSLKSEDGITHSTKQEFLATLGVKTKDELILSFLGFFSELYK